MISLRNPNVLSSSTHTTIGFMPFNNSYNRSTAPYGTWESEITPNSVTYDTTAFLGVRVCPRTGRIFLAESRQSGNITIVQILDDRTSKGVLPVEYNVRTSVHEYGGGAWTILPTGDIIFSNSPDAGVHLLNVDSGNVTSILSNPGSRYADFFPHPHETNLVVAIEEDHQDELDVKNSLVLIDTTNRSKTRSIFSGPDFVTSPRISPDGRYIAWLQWNHPNMPWDGAQLFYSEWNDEISSSGPLQSIKDPKWIAGEHGKSCGEPRWGLDGNLYFLYEQSGYKRIFSTKPNQRKPEEVVLHDLDYVEFGRPEWTLASNTYVFLTETKMVATYNKYGKSTLVTIDIIKEKWDYLQLPLDDITSDALWPISRNSFLVIGGGVTTPRALYRIDLDPEVTMWKLRESSSGSFPAAIFSKPEHILFPTSNNVAAHGYFHPPHSLRFQGPESTSPPLIVSPHGGPTGHYYPGLSLETQYWTSRGFAVLLLNYRGSSGHGGAYRTSLQGQWGIFDTEDAVNAVKYLSTQGKIDGSRVGIRGGSSGGYVVLQAICNFPTVFAGATSLYGISHLRSLIEETHKFESHYAERLLFQPGMSEKERATIVEERSPLNHVDHIQSPLLLLHGSIDKVVPLQQSEKIRDALISRGGMAKLVVFEGEGHGFRQAKNRLTALEEERKWWRKTLVRDT